MEVKTRGSPSKLGPSQAGGQREYKLLCRECSCTVQCSTVSQGLHFFALF